jgi:F-type H+-transporting ATPase subunit c
MNIILIKKLANKKQDLIKLDDNIYMEVQAFKYLAVGILGIAFGGAAIGVGLIFSSALNGISRNPSAESSISKYMFVGAGLAEAMGLFGLVLALLLMFA